MADFFGTEFDDVITPAQVSGGVVASPAGARPSGLSDHLNGLGGDDLLNGGGGDDFLFGGDGWDRLIGGTGADYMNGGLGSDMYFVDNPGDTVVDAGLGDDDEVNSTVSFILPNFVETLALQGSGNLNGTGNDLANNLFGTSGANVLRGLGGEDWLVGQAGDDTLDGGAGDDDMEGGTGNDLYIVSDRFDSVFEFLGEGRDTVRASVTVDLQDDEIEIIELTGTAASNATANEFDNRITGNGAANVLDGRQGDDTLIGGGGADRLLGGQDDDVLRGGGGADFLRGLTGVDILIGGAGADTFNFSELDQSTPAERDTLRAGDGGAAFDGPGGPAGDVIDLRTIDANATLAGDQDFVFGTGTGAGRLWAVDSGSLTLIRGNVNASPAAEFELAIDDGLGVRAADYVAADFIG